MEFWWKMSNFGEEMSEFGEKCWDFEENVGIVVRNVRIWGKMSEFG